MPWRSGQQNISKDNPCVSDVFWKRKIALFVFFFTFYFAMGAGPLRNIRNHNKKAKYWGWWCRQSQVRNCKAYVGAEPVSSVHGSRRIIKTTYKANKYAKCQTRYQQGAYYSLKKGLSVTQWLRVFKWDKGWRHLLSLLCLGIVLMIFEIGKHGRQSNQEPDYPT